ncbi:MAG TPA: hypothetical protein VGN57_00240 [Pirellulaceae bacterium]|nr:hypothetical protein [Pirellulaceae bacterium]
MADPKLLAWAAEADLFSRLRRTRTVHALSAALRRNWMQATLLALSGAFLWLLLFALFGEGFRFLRRVIHEELSRTMIVQLMFNVFFLTLFLMLLMSSALMTYVSLYRNAEVRFLLSRPVSVRRIILHKLTETLFFSNWGFFVLAAPLLLAYGLANGAPGIYYAVFPIFMLAYATIPVCLGALTCLVVVAWLPRLRTATFVGIGLVILGVFIAGTYFLLGGIPHALLTTEWFQELIRRLTFAEQRLFPSWWLSAGLLEAAHLDRDRAPWDVLGYAAIVTTTALVARELTGFIGECWFRKSVSRLDGMELPRRRAGAGLFDSSLRAIFRPFPKTLQTMLMKDLTLLKRDPIQWAQLLLFFVLMIIYFGTLRRFDLGLSFDRWRVILGFLNLAVNGLILSAFTTRFVFPLLSLEGRCIWILGTLPIKRSSVLWSKFAFACIGTIPVSVGLSLINDATLGAFDQPLLVALRFVTCVMMVVGLCALAVGLGARFPDLREPSPAKIANGFGGTMNLLASAAYLLAIILVVAIPSCFLVTSDQLTEVQLGWFWNDFIGLGSMRSVAIGMSIAVGLFLLATVVPMRMGIRAFERLEA